jgi:hypothetical protein
MPDLEVIYLLTALTKIATGNSRIMGGRGTLCVRGTRSTRKCRSAIAAMLALYRTAYRCVVPARESKGAPELPLSARTAESMSRFPSDLPDATSAVVGTKVSNALHYAILRSRFRFHLHAL